MVIVFVLIVAVIVEAACCVTYGFPSWTGLNDED